MDDTVRERLAAMTGDFAKLWSDEDTPGRERKRMLAYAVEDVTLVKEPETSSVKVCVRFRGGRTETLTAPSTRSHADRVRTAPETVALIDGLLDDCLCPDIAKELNGRGILPGGSRVPGHEGQLFCAKRVAYIVGAYGLKPRYERLRDRGMLTRKELADRLGVHEQTLARWAEHGIVRRHAYNAHAFLYEDPGLQAPAKHCSRWDRLADRPHAGDGRGAGSQGPSLQPEEEQYEER